VADLSELGYDTAMPDAAKRLREVKAKLLEMVDRARSDPASLEGRGDVESFLDALEGLAQSLDPPEPAPARPRAKRGRRSPGDADVIRGGPETLASRLVLPPTDPAEALEERVRAALGAAGQGGSTDVQLLLDALLDEMKQLDSGMLSGQMVSPDRIAAAYARLNPLACELVERFIALDRRRARTWWRNRFKSQRPSKLDLGRFEAELDGSGGR
jgi:hypothetical protein